MIESASSQSDSNSPFRRTSVLTVTPPNQPQADALRPAFFLDRDGVLIEEVGYLADPERVVILPTVAEAIADIVGAGYACCVITNQAGLARGYFDIDTVLAIHDRIDERIPHASESIEGYYVCPHHPEGRVEPWNSDCDCRKPNPGMIQRAAKELAIDVKNSFMIGDKLSDLQAGANAGCKTALVRTGYGAEHEAETLKTASTIHLVEIADSLQSAVSACLATVSTN